MADREKLIELVGQVQDCGCDVTDVVEMNYVENSVLVDHLIANSVTVRERGRWIHPKGYVVANGFLCSVCGHEEVSYRQINPRGNGCCIADENGNFYHPPKKNFCPNCGADMRGEEDA